MRPAQSLILASSILVLSILFSGCRDEGGNKPNNQPPIRMISGPINYLALGDSTGVGVGARQGGYVGRLFKLVSAQRPGSRLTNLCVSGATSSDVLHDQLPEALRSDSPTLITLGVGINDIGHGFSVEQFAANYEEILGGLTKTNSVIVVTNIPDISSAPRIPAAARNEYHQLIVNFNQKLEEIASKHGAIMFDIYSITHEQLPLHPEYFSADGFHPSDEGYELWAREMWPLIAKTIGVAS